VIFKLLGSSSFAIGRTLESLIKRLKTLLETSRVVEDDLYEMFLNEYENLDDEADEAGITKEEDYIEITLDDKIAIEEEIKQLEEFLILSNNIQHNEKGEKLLVALDQGFAKLKELGAKQKALIFTESTRTQQYLLERLSKEKYAGRILIFNGNKEKLFQFFDLTLKEKLFEATQDITANMRKRGGGILSIDLIDKTNELENYFQIKASFDTRDSMGANFINSCLEVFGKTLKEEIFGSEIFSEEEKNSLQIIMNILSNYTPECLVRAEVSCKIEELGNNDGIAPEEFAWKFKQAVTV